MTREWNTDYVEWEDWKPLSKDGVSAPYFDSRKDAENYIEKIIEIDSENDEDSLSIHAYPAKRDDMFLKNLKISRDKIRLIVQNMRENQANIPSGINCRCLQSDQLLNEDK